MFLAILFSPNQRLLGDVAEILCGKGGAMQTNTHSVVSAFSFKALCQVPSASVREPSAVWCALFCNVHLVKTCWLLLAARRAVATAETRAEILEFTDLVECKLSLPEGGYLHRVLSRGEGDLAVQTFLFYVQAARLPQRPRHGRASTKAFCLRGQAYVTACHIALERVG